MTHRSKKPFECKFDGCDKSYCDARSLRRHLENHHQQMEAALAAGSESKGFMVDSQHYGQQLTTSDMPHSPSYLQQISPISPAVGSQVTSPTRKFWPAGMNPFE